MSDLQNQFGPMASPVIPTVEEQTPGGVMRYDIFSRLHKERTIVLGSPVMDPPATIVIAQLLQLEADNPDKPIDMVIKSPGGSISDGLAIYDTMQNIKCPIRTIGIGMCASMASFLHSAGDPGMRFLTPNTQVMIHQPRTQGGGGGVETVTDKEANTRLIRQMRHRMEAMYAAFMGVPYDEKFAELIDDAMEQDTYLNAKLAVELGLADEILLPPDYDTNPRQKLVTDNLSVCLDRELEEAAGNKKDPINAALALRDARNEYLASQSSAPAAVANDQGGPTPAPGA